MNTANVALTLLTIHSPVDAIRSLTASAILPMNDVDDANVDAVEDATLSEMILIVEVERFRPNWSNEFCKVAVVEARSSILFVNVSKLAFRTLLSVSSI